jgi:hypothetical protein
MTSLQVLNKVTTDLFRLRPRRWATRPWTPLDAWETSHFRMINWGTNILPTPLELADSSIVEKYRTLANQVTAIK